MIWRLLEATLVVLAIALGVRLAVRLVEPVLPTAAALIVPTAILLIAFGRSRGNQ